SFSGVTLIEQSLTDDKVAVKSSIDAVGLTRTGGTDIPSALITSTNMLLVEPDKGRVIVLFTDGSSTLGNFIDRSMEYATEYVVDQEVVVNSVGIGSETGPIGYLPEYYNISAVYSSETLKRVSNRTGGLMIPASDDESVEEAYVVLLSKAEEGFVGMRIDLGLLVVGILLLFVEWGLINSRYRRIT
ncbi:VWA domain-containing protein, partial [Candidatus Woesearchaeota archaeon]|nr:VWA domain-containing protein [Candidatus Woesearchaeota archaeon]